MVKVYKIEHDYGECYQLNRNWAVYNPTFTYIYDRFVNNFKHNIIFDDR